MDPSSPRSRRPGWTDPGAWIGVIAPLVLVVPLLAIRAQWSLDGWIPDPDLDRSLGPVGRVVAGFSALGGPEMIVLVVAALAGWLVASGRRHDAWLVPVAFLGAHLAARLLKLLVAAPRPIVGGEELYGVHGLPAAAPVIVLVGLLLASLRSAWRRSSLAAAATIATLGVVDGAADVLLPVVPLRDAFPSGHAVASMAVGMIAVVVAPGRWRPVVVPLALAFVLGVGVSRIYLDAHLPADVLAGWCVAIAAISAMRLLDRHGPALRRAIRAPRDEPSA